MFAHVKWRTLILLLGLALSLTPLPELARGAAVGSPRSYESFAEWRDACRRLPPYRELNGKIPRADLLPLPTFAPMSGLLDAYFALCRTGTLAQTALWFGEVPSKSEFFNTDRSYFLKPTIPFQPFTQKLVVSEGAEVVIRGDLH